MKKITYIFLFEIIILLYSYSFTWAIPDSIIKIKDAVVTVIVTDKDNKIISQGTGFYVSKNYIVTNFHVITEALINYSYMIKLMLNKSSYDAFPIFQFTYPIQFTYLNYNSIKIPSLDTFEAKFIKPSNFDHVNKIISIMQLSTMDICLLETSRTSEIFVKLSNTQPIIGQKVYTIGSPMGLEQTFSEGIISAIRNDQYQISNPISAGSSGSPLLDENGYYIGIITSSISDGQNLNFAESAFKLKVLNKFHALYHNIIRVESMLKLRHFKKLIKPFLGEGSTFYSPSKLIKNKLVDKSGLPDDEFSLLRDDFNKAVAAFAHLDSAIELMSEISGFTFSKNDNNFVPYEAICNYSYIMSHDTINDLRYPAFLNRLIENSDYPDKKSSKSIKIFINEIYLFSKYTQNIIEWIESKKKSGFFF